MIDHLFKLLIKNATLDAVDYIIIFLLFWIKFNDLRHIGIWQKKHEKRSEEIWKKITKHGEDIAGLKKGKADK